MFEGRDAADLRAWLAGMPAAWLAVSRSSRADGLDGKLARVKSQVSRVGSLEHAFNMLYGYSWILVLAWAVQRDQGGVAPLVLAGVTVAVVAFCRSVSDEYGKQAGHSLDDAGGFDRRFRRVAGRRNLYNLWILAFVLAGAPAIALWATPPVRALTGLVYALGATTLLRRVDRTVRPTSCRQGIRARRLTRARRSP